MSLHYQFPIINHIGDVLPHIDGLHEFLVVEKDGYKVINYVMQTGDTFPTVDGENALTAAIRRECRGLIFDAEGRVLSRRFHKFFNHGERGDSPVDLSKPHVILEKLDGSMISPIKLPTGVRWTTKMGITTVSMQAEEFVARNPAYIEFSNNIIAMNATPIFEWCSRKQRIVLDYPEDKLVLTAVRMNDTGAYIPMNTIRGDALAVGIPVVGEWDVIPSSQVVNTIRQFEDAEGVVIRFDDGHMVKVKSDWYVSIHRAKSKIESERDVVRVVLDDQVDDLLPVLPKADKAKLVEFQSKVFHDLDNFAYTANEALATAKSMDRKTFALNSPHLSGPVKSCVFHLWDKDDDTLNEAFDWGRSFLYRSCGSNAHYNSKARLILPTAVWN